MVIYYEKGWGWVFGGWVFFDWKMGVEVCFCLKMGCWNIFCSLKFINFLKDVIFYVKQLKFMVLTHFKGVLKFFFFCSHGECQDFCHMLSVVLKFFNCIMTLNNPPPWVNKWLFPRWNVKPEQIHIILFNVVTVIFPDHISRNVNLATNITDHIIGL